MSLDLGTLVAKVRVDDSDFDKKSDSWSTKGAAIGSAFGNVAADAISQVSSMLVDYVGDAAAASDATDAFKKTLEFAGLNTDTIDKLTASNKRYADETVFGLTDVMDVTATLAANGVKDYDTLAMSLGNLTAANGKGAEEFSRAAMAMTQTAGAGKLTTENWNQLTDAIPGASGKLMDALFQAGAYTGNFREAMEKGEITAEEFNAAISLLGNDPIAVEAAKSTETFAGSAGNLSATIQGKLVTALEAVKPVITGFQNGMAWFIDNIGQFTPLLAGLGAVIFAALAPALWAAVVATAAWTVALLANPVTWIVLGIGALVAAIVWLIMNWDTAVAFISDVWSGFISWITGVIDGFVGWWNGVWDGFISWTTSLITGFLSWWGGIWDAVGSFFTDLWQGIVDFAMGVWQFYIGWIIDLIVFFVNNWDAIWARVGSIIEDVWGNIVGFFEGIPGAINDLLAGAGMWLYNIGRDIIDGLWKGLKSIWGSVSRWFEDTFGGIIDTVAGIFDIHSPSRKMEYLGRMTGEGYLGGLEAMADPIERELQDMLAVPTTGGWNQGAAEFGGGTSNVKNIAVHLTEVKGLTTAEQLFRALGSPRVKD